MASIDDEAQPITSMALRPLLIGAASRPHPLEAVNGDRVCFQRRGAVHRLAVIDGLGHGPDAAAAAGRAADTLATIPHADVSDALRACHEALKGTRGAALSVIRIDLDAGRLTFAGLGNVEGVLVSPKGRELLMPQRGIVGAVAPPIHELEVDLPEAFILMLCTDGLRPGARGELRFGTVASAQTLANELLMAWGRDEDDAAVVIASRRPD